jgi:trans-aconitate 2-methyltransferase
VSEARPRDWDGRTYDRVADPMTRWGHGVLDRLPLRPGDRVLDAGCGSGRVTEQLLERMGPDGGTVVALDGSPSMVDAARERLAAYGDRVEYVVADLGQPLPLDERVDAILSTATFHWVPDHDALFRNLAAVLRPGGWLGAVHFETPLDTARRLDASGFVDIECWLQDEPTRFEPGEAFETYLRTVVLGAHLARLPAHEHDAFVAAVVAGLGEPLIDYVRLNIVARLAGR